ncbi:perforin-1-like [Poecilia formosa]|uniref:Perforin-1-like n=1 Tax=Poecilia formosa TaxID=48698 RepID=A0A087YS61_POEFO|nr:PREDICTED: perforin-1-like [Poecilia formosa]
MVSNFPVALLVLCALSLAQAQLRLFNLRASELPSNLLGTADGYVKVFCGATSLGKTAVRKDTANPWWEEEFNYFHALENDEMMLEVYDNDLLFDDLVGVCQRQLQPGTHQLDCFLKKGGTLHYSYTLG